MTEVSDASLWERARGGDAEAFGEIYERHGRAVQSFCLWRAASVELAEDVTATVFLEAWRRREDFELTSGRAMPLLLGIATNVLRNHWRSRRRHAAALERMRGRTPAAPFGDDEDDVDARIDAIRELREAGAAIRALPRREREVLALIAWGDLTYAETAAALAVPVGTVRSRVARARSRLGPSFPNSSALQAAAEEPS